MSLYTTAAIDLDDTLLHHDGSISEATLLELQQWQDEGRQIIIATGRPPRSIGAVLPPSLHTVPWVCYNGAEIRLQNECVYTNYIPADDAQSIIAQILEEMPSALIGLEINDTLYLNRTAERTTPYEVADLTTMVEPAAKILVFNETKAALPKLACLFPSSAAPLYSARYPHFIQILATNCNKATALEHWAADHLPTTGGHALQHFVAFGDDTNDVEMVAACALGVAMDNAVAEVKAVADQITLTNNEDGVAKTLAVLREA